MAEGKHKIVIIEDEQMLAEMYATKLGMENFQVLKAFDGKQGLELVKKEKPDIVLLDIILPKLDGFLVLKEIKKDPSLKSIPVLLLTNLGQESDVKKGNQLGANGYFVKANHSPAEIVNKVKEFLK
jgi:DNA-binding response OmpR family regulator